MGAYLAAVGFSDEPRTPSGTRPAVWLDVIGKNASLPFTIREKTGWLRFSSTALKTI
jgi:hypothetical protein